MSEEGRAVDGGARFARTAKAVIVIGGLDPFASVWRVAAPARLVRAGSATLSPGSDSPRRNDWVWEPTDPSARAQVVPAGSEFNNNTSYRAARLDRGSSDGGNSKGNDGSAGFEVEQALCFSTSPSALWRGCRRCDTAPAAGMRHFWRIAFPIYPAYAPKMRVPLLRPLLRTASR